MAVYSEIIEWSVDKPLYMQDAIRRLLTNNHLTDADIDKLTLLLKKEIGFSGVTETAVAPNESDISAVALPTTNFARLLSIKNPININALYDKAEISFAQDGLTVVYGGNGSGKSSYSRILKKVCWSRQNEIELKPNVYSNDTTEQEFEINYRFNGVTIPVNWKLGQASGEALNSIYVFDSKCADIYLNSENPTEYKPIGTDLLKKLINVCNTIENKLNEEAALLVTTKPELDRIKYAETTRLKWYNKIEENKKEEIEVALKFTEENNRRKNELQALLKQNNPVEENKVLEQKIKRFRTVVNSIEIIEKYFSVKNIKQMNSLKGDYVAKKEAYKLAQEFQKGNEPLEGVGTETWKNMWNAAKEFATNEVHPSILAFPSDKSLENCVFCQQPLEDEAKKRLEKFSAFISDKTNQQFTIATERLKKQLGGIESQNLVITDTFKELSDELTQFKVSLTEFQNKLEAIKTKSINCLKNITQEDIQPLESSLLKLVNDHILVIEAKFQKNKELIKNRANYEKELLEYEALEFLFLNKENILKYFSEYDRKYWLSKCVAKTKTMGISKKIGSILESDSITLQHQEFISHLNDLNPKLSTKVLIKKTKTTNGSTYQKCSFTDVNESLPSVLSDGEQKVVAIANFLSECTIENAKNSIVFDDPVTSLDQDYREEIAKKIVNLSADRQVIVFTHDLYFLRLLLDVHKVIMHSNCNIVGLKESRGVAGIVSDEIPYLAKNIQERVDTIKNSLRDIRNTDVTQTEIIESLLDSCRQRMRKLLEKSIEDILINKTIQRFSKNISAKRGSLASLIVVEKNDTDFLLGLFGKYSITEHDGGIETIPLQPNETIITQDLTDFCTWRDTFKTRLKAYKLANNYN